MSNYPLIPMCINCIVIDDEHLAVEKLSLFIEKIAWLKLEKTFSNAVDALIYLKSSTVDLIFLDIQMDEFSGIQFLKAINVKSKVVITSAYQEYAIQGYDFDVIDYLLKPFGFERFVKSTDKVYKLLMGTKSISRQYCFIKSGYSMARVNFDEILYIEGMQEYLLVVTQTSKLMTLQTFNSIESLLPAGNFLRVHKSFIVAIDKIDAVERHVVRIGTKRIPVGVSYRERFEEVILLHSRTD